MNDFNKKNEVKHGTEDALLLGKYAQASKMQITTDFVFPLFFSICIFSSNQGKIFKQINM